MNKKRDVQESKILYIREGRFIMSKLKYGVFFLGIAFLSFPTQAMMDGENIASPQSSVRQRLSIK